jgi:hypothetical protein
MDGRFDQEFYRSAWRRVLPLGPDGIQPYIRSARISRWSGAHADMGRLSATMGTLAQAVLAFGRRAAIGVAGRPLLLARAPSVERAATIAPRRARSGPPGCAPSGRDALAGQSRSAPRAPGRVAQIPQKELKQLSGHADIIAKHTGTISVRRSGSSGATPDME